jgi:hypothetical protein
MSIPDTESVSALVVLRPQGQPTGPPSAATLHEWAPPAGAQESAAAILRQMGFDVEASGPHVLSISARAGLFHNVFGAALERSPKGGVVCPGGSPDLPLDALPPTLRSLIQSAGFEQPPDFGPGEFI